ncbi:MAG: adenylosuccinate synthase, partial [candidate division WOR-3 bacterium]
QYQGKKYIFHLIPCGLLNKNVIGVVGAGCVFDPAVFINELRDLKTYDPDAERRIKISKFAHLIMPYHVLLDKIREETTQGIGTTKRGIGNAYEDKYARVGIRIGDLYYPELFKEKLKVNISRKNVILMEIYHAEPLSDTEIYEQYMEYAETLRPMVADETDILARAREKNIIFEGAQGSLLDIDFGTYPFVTSSHTISGSASIGCGLPPTCIEKVYGITKAYTTRVGLGPFPTENEEAMGQNLRDVGKEYGATTGRPRRCGPFDVEVVKYAARLSGVTEIVLTKFDVLGSLETILVSVGYENADGFDPFNASKLKPVYKEVPGFKTDISHIRQFRDLPAQAKDYVQLIEEYTNLRVKYISVGPERDAMIKV